MDDRFKFFFVFDCQSHCLVEVKRLDLESSGFEDFFFPKESSPEKKKNPILVSSNPSDSPPFANKIRAEFSLGFSSKKENKVEMW